jgi:hypothetical protein
VQKLYEYEDPDKECTLLNVLSVRPSGPSVSTYPPLFSICTCGGPLFPVKILEDFQVVGGGGVGADIESNSPAKPSLERGRGANLRNSYLRQKQASF